MERFGTSNNSITTAKLVQEANKTYEENMRALDNKFRKDEQYKEKLLESAMELDEIKDIVNQLKQSVYEFNQSSNKVSKRMLWLTIVIAGLTVVYTIVAMIQLAKMV